MAEAQRLGFLGAADVADQIDHALAFEPLLEDAETVADLGSGGGLPGLVLAAAQPTRRIRLIEASTRRADHLRRMVARCSLEHAVVDDRPAEVVGRDPSVRGKLRAVTARSFGPPATTAECAAPLLAPGGRLVVSEPPQGSHERWRGLDETDLPLVLVDVVRTPSAALAVLELRAPCPDRFPRAVGTPRRRPLF